MGTRIVHKSTEAVVEERAKNHKPTTSHIHLKACQPSDSPNPSKAYGKKAGEEVKIPASA